MGRYFGTVGLYATSTSSKVSDAMSSMHSDPLVDLVHQFCVHQLAEGCNAHWSRYDTLMELANLTSFSALHPNWDWKSADKDKFGAYSCDIDNGTYKFPFCEAGRYTPPQVVLFTLCAHYSELLCMQCVDNPDCVDVVMNRSSSCWQP